MPAAQAGEADAAWFASRVYDYCAAHATDPAAYARDTGALGRMQLAASAAMRAARDRVAHRCRQFVPGDGLGAGLVILQRLEAAEAGSLAAEAGLLAMGEPLEDSEDYRRGLAERVQLPYLHVDPFKIDFATVTKVMSNAYANRFKLLPVEVTPSEVVIATCEPKTVPFRLPSISVWTMSSGTSCTA